MSLTEALFFALDMHKTAIQNRLDVYFRKNNKGEPMSQQAYSKCRSKFDHTPFSTLFKAMVQKEYSGEYKLPLWHGYHLFSIDGIYLNLPKEDVLKTEFGTYGSDDNVCAGSSILYDVLHGWAINPILANSYMNERAECLNHLNFINSELSHIKDNIILLLDRGYPSEEIFSELQSSGVKFLIRCSSKAISEIRDAPMGDSIIYRNGMKLRVYKFLLSTSEVEILVTNLFDIPEELLSELYSLRWCIETMFNVLKNQLCIEKFTGRSVNAIKQDYWATLILINTVAVYQNNTNTIVAEKRSMKKNKHKYKVTTSKLIISLRDNFVLAGLGLKSTNPAVEMKKIIEEIVRNVTPIRPNRSFEREKNKISKDKTNLKSHL